MADDRVRLFVALELPEPVREALTRWRDGVVHRDGSVRPVATEALHVTLCFLGWCGAEEVEAIAGACSIVASEPTPALRLGEPLWLPRRRPRVLAVELADPEGTLARVQAALSAALSRGGWYEPENRPYLAHVTLARVRGGGGGREASTRGGRPPELPAPPSLHFHGSRVVLYRSHLSRAGARYEPLSSVQLAPSAGGA